MASASQVSTRSLSPQPSMRKSSPSKSRCSLDIGLSISFDHDKPTVEKPALFYINAQSLFRSPAKTGMILLQYLLEKHPVSPPSTSTPVSNMPIVIVAAKMKVQA